MTALEVLRRLLTEIKQDNTNTSGYDCLWCGRSANSNYDAVVGFTWHADDCAYLAAHTFLMVEEERSAGKAQFLAMAGYADIHDVTSTAPPEVTS